MSKLPDWETRLGQLVAAAHSQPFAWGERDCCLWVADAVEAQTGDDRSDGLRGTYSDITGAAKALRRVGGLRGVGSRAGESIPPLTAMNGDVGVVRLGSGKRAMGVCTGHVWLVAGTSGLVALPYGAALEVWRVA